MIVNQAERNTSKVYSICWAQDFPCSCLIYSCFCTSDQDSSKQTEEYKFFMRLFFMGTGFASGSQHDLPQHVCWHLLHALKCGPQEKSCLCVFMHVCVAAKDLRRISRSWTGEDEGGVSSQWLFYCFSSFNNNFRLFLGTRLLLFISWQGEE